MTFTEQDNSPKTYLISIAVSDYKHFDRVENAVVDSDAIITCLIEKYKVDLHTKLHDVEFSEENIEKTFKELESKVKTQDSVILFYNGHGELDNKDLLYWIPSKAEKNTPSSWYLATKIINEIDRLDVAHAAIIVNCCESGRMHNQVINAKKSLDKNIDVSRWLLTGGKIGQNVPDSSRNSNFSPFTEGLVKYLFSNNNSKISLSELKIFIQADIAENNNSNQKPLLNPFGGHQGGDFFLVLKEDDKAYWLKKDKNGTGSIEAYLSYTYLYPEGDFIQNANKRIDELQEERTKWLETIKEIKASLLKFKTENEKTAGPYLKKAHESINKYSEQITDLETVENVEIHWKKIRNSDVIEDFLKFEVKYPNSRYKNDSKRRREKLDGEDKAKKAWAALPTKANYNTRRAGLIAFVQDYRNISERVKEANQMIDDIDKYIEAVNEENIDEKIEKLIKYIKQEKKGEYFRQANDKLAELQGKKIQERFEIRLQSTKEESLILEYYEIREEIEGLTLIERQSVEIILETVNNKITQYESQRQNDFDKALATSKKKALIDFVVSYEQGDLVKKAIDIFQNKEQNEYDEACLFDSIEGFKAFKLEFEAFKSQKIITLNYFSKVEKRLRELKDDKEAFEKAETLEALEQYVSDVKSEVYAGKYLQDAAISINNLEIEEKKKVSYEQIMREMPNKQCIDLCDEFIFKFKDYQDERNTEVEKKRDNLVMVENRKQAYNDILNEEDLNKKIKFCSSFMAKYSDEEDKTYIAEVVEIRENTEFEKADNEDFEMVKSIIKIDERYEAIISYLSKENARHKLEANVIKEDLKLEIEKDHKEFENAKNTLSVVDRIEALEKYLSNDYPLNKTEAEKILKASAFEKEDDELFENTKSNNDTIQGWGKYISFSRNEERKIWAIDRRDDLKRVEEEEKAFKEAKKDNTKESYDKYFEKYKKDGRNAQEADRLRSLIILGIDDSNKVSESEKMQNVLADFSSTFSTAIAATVTTVLTKQEENNKVREKKSKKAIYRIMFVAFIVIIIVVIGIILGFRK